MWQLRLFCRGLGPTAADWPAYNRYIRRRRKSPPAAHTDVRVLRRISLAEFPLPFAPQASFTTFDDSENLMAKRPTNSRKRSTRPTADSADAAEANNDAEANDVAETNGTAELAPASGRKPSRRRATAQSMAASQRDISVSEFFAKNRHLLGFDNPRKALLTTIKEAVDNSLDACEEAGILPEVWVHVEQTGANRYKVGVQDNGPGILKKQIPLIFGKLLYGSKFHRLRMSRGQQGIGISAAGMYGVLTTGKPVKIISKISPRKPAHYYEIKIDTKKNVPEILNGRGEGVDIPPGDPGRKTIEKHGIEWVELNHGTRVTIELEGKFIRGRGSVDEYLEQTAIANPHVTIHYLDPEAGTNGAGAVVRTLGRSTAARTERNQAAPVWHRAGHARHDAQRRPLDDPLAVPYVQLQPRQLRRGQPRVPDGRAEHALHDEQDRTRRCRQAVSRLDGNQDLGPLDRLHLTDRRRIVAQGAASRRAGRVLRRQHAAASRVSGQSLPDRSGPGLRRHVGRQPRAARRAGRPALGKRRPYAATISDDHLLRPRQRRRRPDHQAGRSQPAHVARQDEEQRTGQAARGDEKRQPGSRPNDERAAICQSRAVAVPTRGVRHYPDGDEHQLAGLRAQPVAGSGCPAGR